MRARLGVEGGKAIQGICEMLLQPLGFKELPFVKGRAIAQGEARQKISLVERGGGGSDSRWARSGDAA